MSTRTRQLSFFEQLKTEEDVICDRVERPETYTGIYGMHKYWSKKPHNLVARYIEKYSKRGEVVLDPFCGSGVAAIESVRLNRRAIGTDINPIAVLCTQMGLELVDTKRLKRSFDLLRKEVEKEIDQLYYTECPKCGNINAIGTHTIWITEQPKEIWVSCEVCKVGKAIKTPSEHDKKLSLTPPRQPVWYPTLELMANNRINAKAGMRICDLFTPRALAGLSLLLEKIRQIEDEKVRRVMEFCFSAMLPQASNMVFVIRRRGKFNGKHENERAEVGSRVIGYWVPEEHFEIHVWRCFENRFRRILKGKQEVNMTIPPAAVACSSFDELNGNRQGYWVSKGTATSLAIPSDSIDYIFTDPPHGNRIPYLELSLIWNAWLGLDFEWENEIVVSEAKSRHKDAIDYQNRLAMAFREMWRVLKAGKYASIAFNSLDDATWLSLLNALLAAGFEIIEISPLEYSARSVIQDTRWSDLWRCLFGPAPISRRAQAFRILVELSWPLAFSRPSAGDRLCRARRFCPGHCFSSAQPAG
ncbi:50S ribosomal protein L11 methyltransferase [candidate division KSB1 bacterium]|nr:50S ribosomal protein L11 methyltransferase [candidate division KSB1 bacterium]